MYKDRELAKQKDREYSKTYYAEHREDIKSKRKLYHKIRSTQDGKYYRTDPIRRILQSAKSRASKLNIEFNLTPSDIIIPEYCPYLGLKLEFNTGHQKANSPSLDRINSTLGYVKGNIMVISHKANQCKNNLTIPALKNFAENILRLHP